MANLDDSVRYLKGICEQRAKLLHKLGIDTLKDLISYFPRTYEDRTKIVPIKSLEPNVPACFTGIVASPPLLTRVRKGMELVKFRVADESGAVDVTYFNQSYIRQQIKEGETYTFYGKLALEGYRRSMINPLFEKEGAGVITGRIMPVYRLTAGISQKIIMSSVLTALKECADFIPEVLPEAVLSKYKLCRSSYAYENIHFPKDIHALDLARQRLVFEELFVLSCALSLMKKDHSKKNALVIPKADLNEFYSGLPFSPTSAQKRAIEDAVKDMASGYCMNRLVQGDVGSGKTLVAAATVWCAVKSGRQCAFMAPTEILANQHFDTCTELLSPYGRKIGKLTGSMTPKQKQNVKAKLLEGEIDLAVGTHALISDNVEFKDLALVITDEQHRFGVNQRAALIAKGESPHTLVMSATPIPRTLALMIYGDLDVSIIDELPPGRLKVDTFAVGEELRQRVDRFMHKQVDEGHQIFVVCPAIEENEENPAELKSAVDYAKELQENILPDLRIGCVHGKMSAVQKDKTMLAFSRGDLDILVSTTVVEVGVDVPNASLMVIENAERFGLSQLHQLRGRVGRGKHKSYCILLSDKRHSDSQSRLKVMEKTNDGFKISEEDLKLRGPGDFFGSRQHGLPEMHIADLGTDTRVLKEAQDAANEVLSIDPELNDLDNKYLKKRIYQLFEVNEDTLN